VDSRREFARPGPSPGQSSNAGDRFSQPVQYAIRFGRGVVLGNPNHNLFEIERSRFRDEYRIGHSGSIYVVGFQN
jgi:hypothetical protein